MIALTLLFLVPAALAQYGNPGSSSSSASSAPSSATVAAPAASQSGVHDVDVGSGGSLTYNPNSLTAAVGDKVNFHFFPFNHSVVQSTFSEPCTPTQSQAIFSGFMPVSSGEGSSMFTITINDTNPIWLYCAQTVFSHCQSGMAMVINPPGNNSPNTLAAYQAAAKNAKTSVAPPIVQGGTFSQNKISTSTSASSTGSSTSAPPVASKTGGAQVGRSVGWAAVGVSVAGGVWAWALM